MYHGHPLADKRGEMIHRFPPCLVSKHAFKLRSVACSPSYTPWQIRLALRIPRDITCLRWLLFPSEYEN